MVEQAILAQIREACQAASTAYQLVHDFHKIVKGRLGEELDSWLNAAMESGILAMQNFAAGIVRDKAAVSAAITLDWSNGQVEGQVNRLKLRKRQLYGRANFDLLRQYVLNSP
jgi:transposase